MADPKYLTVGEAAKRLRLHMDTARRFVRDGKLPATKVGRRYLIPATAIEDLISKGFEATKKPPATENMEHELFIVNNFTEHKGPYLISVAYCHETGERTWRFCALSNGSIRTAQYSGVSTIDESDDLAIYAKEAFQARADRSFASL